MITLINKLLKVDETLKSERMLYVLGTIVQLKAYGRYAEEAIQDAVHRLNEIDDKMSVFKDYSEISMINKNAGNTSKTVSSDVFNLIKSSLEYSNLLEGSFDITISPLVSLWGIGTKKEKIPRDEEIIKTKQLVNYKDVILDEKNKRIMLKNKNQSIDLGGIAKGYAADEVRNIFKKYNIKSALIDLGGNIFVLGKKENKKLWKVGIQDPFKKRGVFLGVIKIQNKSIVTSGNYEKFFVHSGKRYHHIIDPRTGYPSESEIISATVISDKSIDGDGLSTGLYILGVEKAIEIVEENEGIDAIFITKDKKIYLTSGIKKKFNLINKEYTYYNQ